MPESGVVQLSVMAALGHQLVVGALFDDLAVVHDDDFNGRLHQRLEHRLVGGYEL